jgi:hypothetical protein
VHSTATAATTTITATTTTTTTTTITTTITTTTTTAAANATTAAAANTTAITTANNNNNNNNNKCKVAEHDQSRNRTHRAEDTNVALNITATYFPCSCYVTGLDPDSWAGPCIRVHISGLTVLPAVQIM